MFFVPDFDIVYSAKNEKAKKRTANMLVIYCDRHILSTLFTMHTLKMDVKLVLVVVVQCIVDVCV